MIRSVLIPIALVICVLVGFSTRADAQDRAALVADTVSVDPNGRLVAQGGVEVFFKGRILRAASITYDRAADRMTMTGPILLVDGTDTILIADQAELSADLTEGILTSARLVLNRELQLAAAQIQRVGGRYLQLDRVVASSCKVCADNPTPLWEIRARRVVHDQEARQIYFNSAQFRVAGMPVAWFPRLRIPDPSLQRATGFLMPSLRTTSGLGTGFKVPYFVALGPHKDLTVTPYFSTKGGRTLELRYRQAFATGEIELSGALSRDEILAGKTRSRVTAQGTFTLPANFQLAFSAEDVSDPGYLLDYGYPDKDRLDSRVEVSRTRRNEYISGRLINFRSIRAGDVNSILPSVVTDFTYHRRFSGGPLGGEAGLLFQTHGHYRSSTEDTIDSNGDGIIDGRDVQRAMLRLDWRRNWMLPLGMVGSVLAETRADLYSISQDTTFGGTQDRTHAAIAAELRWPWTKVDAKGASHIIEPVVQFVWARSGRDRIPNEDSRLTEFDEGNLFDLNRFPGADSVERGRRLNIGVSYSRIGPTGWALSGAVGRVYRGADLAQFSAASGLDGKASNWLAAVHLQSPEGLGFGHRMLIDDGFSLSKSETRVSFKGKRFDLAGSYLWIIKDPAEDRPDPISEFLMDASFKVTNNWTAFGQTRYDFEADRANRAAIGFQYRTECVSVDLSLSRRFTSSTSVKPTTDFGLSIDLVGLGRAAAGPARTCRR